MTIPARIVATNITGPGSLLLTDAICLPKATKIFRHLAKRLDIGLTGGSASMTSLLLLRNTRRDLPVHGDVVVLLDRLNRHQFVAKLERLPPSRNTLISNKSGTR